jgi:hypothetical protein
MPTSGNSELQAKKASDIGGLFCLRHCCTFAPENRCRISPALTPTRNNATRYHTLQLHALIFSLLLHAFGTVACMPTARPPKRLHTTNVRLDDATLNALRAIALEENRTVSNLIGTIIRDWLNDRQT